MRIAVSGTHCSGKSTLIEDFIAAHRDYVHEPEPYEWLQGVFGEVFAERPTAEDFYRQLEFSVDRLRSHERGARLIVERSPVDFLAYILAMNDLERSGRDCAMAASTAELAAAGLANIDLLVVLPLNQKDGLVPHESEDLELRDAMNEQLLDLITTDPYSLFGGGHPHVIEVVGTREQRLRSLEQVACRR